MHTVPLFPPVDARVPPVRGEEGLHELDCIVPACGDAVPRNVIAGRPGPEAEAVELVVRPPGRVVVRAVEPVASVPRTGRFGAHDVSSPVEEALRARCLPNA